MNREQELLEILLEGRSEDFKAKVLEIAYRHQLDPNDPNLQILIATGQLEVLLTEMPEHLQQIVDRAGRPRICSLRIDGTWQTAAFGWGIAIAFGSLGLWGGWWFKSAQIYQHYSPAQLVYLDKLWQMNSDRLLQCQQQGRAQCPIQLKPTPSPKP